MTIGRSKIVKMIMPAKTRSLLLGLLILGIVAAESRAKEPRQIQELNAKTSKVGAEGIFRTNMGFLIVEKRSTPPTIVVFQQQTKQPATFFEIPVDGDELKRETYDQWPPERWLFRVVDSDRYSAEPREGKKKVRGRIFHLKRIKPLYVDFQRKGSYGILESKCPQVMQIDSASSAHMSTGFYKFYVQTLSDTFVGNEVSFEFKDRVFRNNGTQTFTRANGAAVAKPVLVEIDPPKTPEAD